MKQLNIPEDESMLKMSFGEKGFVMAIVGVSPESTSLNSTCLKLEIWSHVTLTEPGVVMIGAWAENECKTQTNYALK